MEKSNVEGTVNYESTTRYVLGVVAGSVILFPTIFSAISPPYVLDFFLYSFWMLAFLAFVFLSFAFHLSSLSGENAPVRTTGLGNNFAFLSLLSLFIFICGNIFSDRISKPEILSVTADKYTVSPNEIVSLSATASDNDGDHLRWHWIVEQEDVPHKDPPPTKYHQTLQSDLRTAQWIVPDSILNGFYRVAVQTNDGNKLSNKQFIVLRVHNGR
ncbi:hypothetical protein [Ruegeria arenilitoris]|uniref:hypothetical protein n=1 Tax=Ruegeria arenilitoris TaxID=1173585 RepID=UPI00147C052E|nr:hypothetical protein [Ruegeria arenilitoris]